MRFRRSRRLQHQLFLWFGLTSLATVLAAGLALRSLEPVANSWPRRLQQLSQFAAQQFAERWRDAQARHAFARQIADAFEVTLWLEDAEGRALERVGEAACRGPEQRLEITRDGVALGRVRACLHGARTFGPALLAVLGSACVVLWVAAALVARRLVRPLSLLIATTREIGTGNLSARVRLGRHQKGELGLLAESVNDMAQRIERQMRDQRELLAVVSHEVRSPLARLRVATEILRGGATTKVLDAVEREVTELDLLVGKLLASSRLDFETLSKQSVVASELFVEVLERRALAPSLLEDQSSGRRVHVDPTLIARALDNLLDNAERHAGGATRCRVWIDTGVAAPDGAAPAEGARAREGASTPDERGQPAVRAPQLVFEVSDAGPGFAREVLPRVFEAFQRAGGAERVGAASLGLGLSLVRRIARAHGGRAWVQNRTRDGATVAFSVALSAAPVSGH